MVVLRCATSWHKSFSIIWNRHLLLIYLANQSDCDSYPTPSTYLFDCVFVQFARYGVEQTALMVGLTWIPHEHVRFLANYSYLMIDGGPFGAIANPGNPSDEEFSIDVLGIRAQVDWWTTALRHYDCWMSRLHVHEVDHWIAVQIGIGWGRQSPLDCFEDS